MLDQPLAYLTRRLIKLRGGWRIADALRRYYTPRYAGRSDAWVVIHDYDGDLTFKLDRAAYMSSAIYWCGYHHIDERRAIGAFLHPEAVFVDVGANIGEFSLYAAKRLTRGQVWAFEPFPPIVRVLKENVARNKFYHIHVIPAGLGETPGVFPFYSATDHSPHIGIHEGLTTMYATPSRAELVGEGEIRRLDDVVQEKRFTRLDLIKIDVEGAELPVLRGAQHTIQRFHPAVLLEINEEMFRSAGYTTQALLSFMTAYGYTPYLIGLRGALQPVSRDLPALCNVIFRVHNAWEGLPLLDNPHATASA